MKINNYFKSIAIVLLILLSLSSLHSQSLKKLGAGLNEPVLSACSDDAGNIYAVCRNQRGDSLIVNYFNTINQSWTRLSKITLLYSTPNCFFINNNLYVMFLDSIDFNTYYVRYSLKKFSNNIWSDDLKLSNGLVFYDLFVNKINSNLVSLTGLFKEGNSIARKSVLYDGNTATTLNDSVESEFRLNPYKIETKGDTLFTISKNLVLFKKIGTKNLNTYFASNKNIQGIFFTDSLKYFLDFDSLYSFNRNSINSRVALNSKSYDIKSIVTHKNNLILHKYLPWFNHLVEMKSSKHDYLSTIASYSQDAIDTTEYTYFKSSDNKIYHFSANKINYNGVDLGNIVELVLDSINSLKLDTIVIKQFKDNNENYVFDNGDQNLSNPFFIDNVEFNTNSDGIYNYYHYDGYNPKIQGSNKDCITVPFSGFINSKTSSPNISLDSIYIPYIASKNINLAIKSNSFHQARLLDTITLRFKVENKSCVANNGNVNVELKLNPLVRLISSSPNFSNKNGNTLNFSITNLFNSQSREIQVKVVYPLNHFRINQIVKHYLKITPFASDMDSTDNRDSIMQRIVYSYDPNAKFSLPEGRITSDLRKIKYTIHFQNEGNDDARNVTIIDTINLKMPVYSFQMIGATHPYTVSIQPGTNIVTWQFNNINLKPKSENEEKSKGYLVFEANVRGDLRVGDSIRNKAYIYFDYNEPIITNYAVITRVEEKGNGINVNKVVGQSNTIEVYPNPTSKVLNIKNLKNENVNFEVFNSLGQSVLKHNLNLSDTYLLNCENLSKGIYFIATSTGDKVKFVIQ